jgi:hypothetical protein
MLGKLTRWLRMLGQDVEYSTQLDDNQLLEKTKSENRILLTRDLELYQRAMARGLETFYVQGKDEAERLAELSKRFGLQLKMDMNASHCPRCNTKLNPIKKEQTKNEIEKNTYLYYEEFWKCPNCGHVYWQGAHWKQIQQTLAQAELKRK